MTTASTSWTAVGQKAIGLEKNGQKRRMYKDPQT